METNLALVLLLSPFVGFLFNIFFGSKVSRNVSGAIGTLTVVVSFLLSICFFCSIEPKRKTIRNCFIRLDSSK